MGIRHSTIGAMIVGAGLMYLADPRSGRRRRAQLRDQLVHAGHKLENRLDAGGRDLRHRAEGVAARTRNRFRGDGAEDEVLRERVRAELGRAVTHPGSIDVDACEGEVVLSGPVLEREAEELLDAVASVRGVQAVIDRLERHETAGDVPGLQGGGRRPGHVPDVLQENWAPGTQILMTALGGTVVLFGRRLPSPLGVAVGAVGATLILRSLTNLQTKRLIGFKAGRRAVEVQKMINVEAPVDEVFAFWSRFENFPRFMSHLREVRRTGEDTSHWVAEGPAGTHFSWDAITTEYVPNQRIAWKSVEGSTIGTAGWVNFVPNEQGGTRIDVHMVYNPPAGAVGHAIASLFGADPLHAMHEDLVRFKSLIEDGRTTAHGHTVTRQEIEARSRPSSVM